MQWLMILMAACTPFRVLPVHQPAQLRNAPSATDPIAPVQGWNVVLELVEDDSLAPVGARFDSGRSQVDQTLVLPQPGYVVFEAFGRALEEGGATVWRSYGPVIQPVLKGARTLSLHVRHVELHHFRYPQRGQVVDAIAAKVELTAVVDGTPYRLAVRRQVPADSDVFEAIGRALANELAEARP